MNFNIEKKSGDIVVGIDEVGRGTLAGPVVAVAVYIKISLWNKFIKKYPDIIMIDDSKKIDHQSSIERYKHLKNFFNNKVGLLHGSLSKEEKNEILNNFLMIIYICVLNELEQNKLGKLEEIKNQKEKLEKEKDKLKEIREREKEKLKEINWNIKEHLWKN